MVSVDAELLLDDVDADDDAESNVDAVSLCFACWETR